MAGTRNLEQAPNRAALKYWQGLDVTGYEQPPNLLNAEYLQSINAAGSGVVNVIGVDASDRVVFTGGVPAPLTFRAGITLAGTAPATAANWGVIFFTASVACKVSTVSERHATAGSDGSAVTFMLKKVPSGTAAGSGTDCLAAGSSLKSTADTNVAPALHATAGNYTLAAGDSLAAVLTGTPTSLAGVGITVNLQLV